MENTKNCLLSYKVLEITLYKLITVKIKIKKSIEPKEVHRNTKNQC